MMLCCKNSATGLPKLRQVGRIWNKVAWLSGSPDSED